MINIIKFTYQLKINKKNGPIGIDNKKMIK